MANLMEVFKMKQTTQIMLPLGLALSFGLALSACNPVSQSMPNALQMPQKPSALTQTSQPISATDPGFNASVRVKEIQDQKATIEVGISFGSGDFKTQALSCASMSFFKVSVSGLGISTPLLPATPTQVHPGLITGGGCTLTGVTFTNIPVGESRWITVEAYDSSQNPLSGTKIMGLLNVSAVAATVEVSHKTTPLAQLIETLTSQFGAEGKALVSRLDIAALRTFCENLIGVSGSFPNYSYTRHPSTLNISALATDLKNANGNIASLNANNPAYQIATGTVTGTITGLNFDDSLILKVRDPLSTTQTPTATGPSYNFNFPNVAPGTWSMYLENQTTSVIRNINVAHNATGLNINLSPPLSAAWAQDGPDGGGIVHGLARGLMDNTIVYAASERGVYRSSNSGNNWTYVNLGQKPVLSLAVHSSDSSDATVFAGTRGSGIYKTTNSGSSWDAITPTAGFNNLVIHKILVDPDNNQNIYAATNDGVIESNDGGVNWSKVNLLSAGGNLAGVEVTDIDKISGGAYYIAVPNGTHAGVYRTSSPGSGWNAFFDAAPTGAGGNDLDPLNGPRKIGLLNGAIYVGTQMGQVYQGSTAAINWDALVSGLGRPVNALAYNAPSSHYYAATEGSGVQLSAVPSTSWSWSALKSGPPPINSPFVNAIDTVNASGGDMDVLVATQGGGISRTGSTQWNTANSGFSAAHVNEIKYYNNGPGYRFLATRGGGVFRHDGSNWEHLLAVPPNNGKERFVVALEVDANGNLYALHEGGIHVLPSAHTAATSTPWLSFNTGGSSIPTLAQLSDIKINGTNLYVSAKGSNGQQGVYKSTCLYNGSTCQAGDWSKVNANNVFSLAIHRTNTNTVYAGRQDGNIDYTTNAGTTWNTHTTGFSLPVVDMHAPTWSGYTEDIFAVSSNDFGSAQIKRYNAAGSNWLNFNGNIVSNKSSLSILSDDNQTGTLFVGLKNGGVFRSTDGLSTGTVFWDAFNGGGATLPMSDLSPLSLFINSGNLYAGTDGKGLYRTCTSAC